MVSLWIDNVQNLRVLTKNINDSVKNVDCQGGPRIYENDGMTPPPLFSD